MKSLVLRPRGGNDLLRVDQGVRVAVFWAWNRARKKANAKDLKELKKELGALHAVSDGEVDFRRVKLVKDRIDKLLDKYEQFEAFWFLGLLALLLLFLGIFLALDLLLIFLGNLMLCLCSFPGSCSGVAVLPAAIFFQVAGSLGLVSDFSGQPVGGSGVAGLRAVVSGFSAPPSLPSAPVISWFFYCFFDVESAEALGLLRGLSLVVERRFFPCVLKSDSKFVVQLCIGAASSRVEVDNIIQDVQVFLSRFACF
ncbi:hypothetical protein ACOSQ4_024926 [Xanthoceras sorbifolium]